MLQLSAELLPALLAFVLRHFRPFTGITLQPGIYDLSLLLPKDARTDGHYEIRAYEYNTGQELDLDRDACRISLTPAQDSGERVWELDSLRAWAKTHFMVYTGDWGQYYGSRWELWFVPNKGEREKICEQLFLMQGWMR